MLIAPGVIRWPTYRAIPGTRRVAHDARAAQFRDRSLLPFARRRSSGRRRAAADPAVGQAGMAEVPGLGGAAGPVNRQVHDPAACVLVYRVVRDGRDQAR